MGVMSAQMTWTTNEKPMEIPTTYEYVVKIPFSTHSRQNSSWLYSIGCFCNVRLRWILLTTGKDTTATTHLRARHCTLAAIYLSIGTLSFLYLPVLPGTESIKERNPKSSLLFIIFYKKKPKGIYFGLFSFLLSPIYIVYKPSRFLLL